MFSDAEDDEDDEDDDEHDKDEDDDVVCIRAFTDRKAFGGYVLPSA